MNDQAGRRGVVAEATFESAEVAIVLNAWILVASRRFPEATV